MTLSPLVPDIHTSRMIRGLEPIGFFGSAGYFPLILVVKHLLRKKYKTILICFYLDFNHFMQIKGMKMNSQRKKNNRIYVPAYGCLSK